MRLGNLETDGDKGRSEECASKIKTAKRENTVYIRMYVCISLQCLHFTLIALTK